MRIERYIFPSRRSNVIAANGMVATSQPLAAQAGLAVLQSGGNAVDAAIATAAALCVVEPCSTGIGGDAFALIWWAADKKLYGINASGPAPAGLTADWIRNQGHDQMPERGGISVTVPGSLRGWQLALERFGSRGLDALLAQPLDYARNGFPVSQRIAAAWQRSKPVLSYTPESSRCWLPGDRAPRAGEIFRNPDFAKTLELIAERGYEEFYGGETGVQIAETVQSAGGVLTIDDLSIYRAQWVEPLSIKFRQGFTFHEIPPNGQGLTALIALNLANSFDLKAMGYGTADYYHTLIESTKLAFADAFAFIADPEKAAVPVQGLLNPAYAERRRAQIDPGKARTPAAGRPDKYGDTVYITVADSDGNMVSWIQSLYMGFGSGLTAGTTGIQLQNRGANFVLTDGHPNQVAPGKRPYNTIIPGFITKDGQAWSSFGVMGGFMQPQGHLQVGINLVDFEMDPQAALDAPRFNWLSGNQVAIEGAVPEDVYKELASRGHELVPREDAGKHKFGGGQVIVRDDESGVLIAGSEPRNDGAAVGW